MWSRTFLIGLGMVLLSGPATCVPDAPAYYVNMLKHSGDGVEGWTNLAPGETAEGLTITTSEGPQYVNEAAYGHVAIALQDVLDTPMLAAELYRAEWFAGRGDLMLTFEVDSSTPYTLMLHFAENYLGVKQDGVRTFDVQVNGEVVATNFDITKEAGGPQRAVSLKVPGITPSGPGLVHVVLIPHDNKPLLNAVELYPEGGRRTGATDTPVPLSIAMDHESQGGPHQEGSGPASSVAVKEYAPAEGPMGLIEGPEVAPVPGPGPGLEPEFGYEPLPETPAPAPVPRRAGPTSKFIPVPIPVPVPVPAGN